MSLALIIGLALAVRPPVAAPTPAPVSPVNTQAGGPGSGGSGPSPCPSSGPVFTTSHGDEAGTATMPVGCAGPRPSQSPFPQLPPAPMPQPPQLLITPCPQPSGGVPMSHGDEAGQPHNGSGCARPGTTLGAPIVPH